MQTNTQKQKDENLFEQLYLSYRDLLFYVAYSILHDIPTAEDAVQQAFMRVLRHLDKIEGPDCPKTRNFLVIIVKNIAINLYHARRKRDTVSFDEVDGWVGAPRDEIAEMESAQRLSDLMKRLPESYRDALMLRYDNGYSCAEIAQLLGISEENVRKRIQRARARLADEIAREEAELDA